MIRTRTGGSDDGPLLVLLHGLGVTAEAWRGVEELLPDLTFGRFAAMPSAGMAPPPGRAPPTGRARAVVGLLSR